jgi:hypothetical protein
MLVAAALWLIGLGVALATPSQSVLTPPIEIPFAAGTRPADLDQTIRITEKRSYSFDLNIYYFNRDEMPAVAAMAGSGARYPDGRYAEPGIMIPIHLRVVLAGNSTGDILFDKIVETQGIYSHGFTRTEAAYYGRVIAGLVLPPGLYRISVNAPDGIPEPLVKRVRFAVTYDARFLPLR